VGVCSYRKKTIFLSKPYTLANDESIIYEVILHEIAHAIVGIGNAHNHIWKRKCIELGIKPNVTTKHEALNIPVPDYKRKSYHGVCINCGKDFYRYRQPKMSSRKQGCIKCCTEFNGRKYSDKYQIVWDCLKNQISNDLPYIPIFNPNPINIPLSVMLNTMNRKLDSKPVFDKEVYLENMKYLNELAKEKAKEKEKTQEKNK